MKKQNALTVRPESGLSELKRAKSLIRLTQSVLGKPMPAHNRTDEQGRKQGRWTENVPGGVWEGSYVDDKRHGHWVERFADGTVREGPYVPRSWRIDSVEPMALCMKFPLWTTSGMAIGLSGLPMAVCWKSNIWTASFMARWLYEKPTAM